MCFLTITTPSRMQTTAFITNSAIPAVSPAPWTLSFIADADQDGQADAWEAAHGLSSTDATDRNLDSDGDGMLNWQEYIAGTDPTDAISYLRVDSILVKNGAGAALSFWARSNRTYAVEYTDALETGEWSTLGDIPAQTLDREESLTDPGFHSGRFYRLVTPVRAK
jgi:hypothetical protein